MVKQILFLLGSCFAILCSQLDVGTDVTTIGNVINDGAVQAGWSYHDAGYKSSPAESEIYFYVKGFTHLGPEFDVQEFHHEDERNDDEHRWIFMNITVDEKIDGLFKDIRAYKVTQQCVDRDGGTTLHLNVTFKAFSCDPITFNWLKVCGEPTSTREGLNIGLKESGSELVRNGVVTSLFDGNIKNKVYIVPAIVDTLTIYAYLTESFLKAFYKEPYLITDHEVLYPTLTGDFAKTGWIEGEVLDLTINFNCLVKDGKKEEVIMVVELPYFHDLEIHFFKICGETAQKSAFWKYFFYLAVVGGIVAAGLVFYKFYSNFEQNEGLSEVFKNLLNLCKFRSSGLLGKKDQSHEMMDDDGKNGLNVHTLYGTA